MYGLTGNGEHFIDFLFVAFITPIVDEVNDYTLAMVVILYVSRCLKGRQAIYTAGTLTAVSS